MSRFLLSLLGDRATWLLALVGAVALVVGVVVR